MDFWNSFFLLLIYIPLIMVWGFAVLDIFRRDDIHGGSKALWLVVVIFLPFIGTLIYLIMRQPGSTPEERQALADAQRDYVAQRTGGVAGRADQGALRPARPRQAHRQRVREREGADPAGLGDVASSRLRIQA